MVTRYKHTKESYESYTALYL